MDFRSSPYGLLKIKKRKASATILLDILLGGHQLPRALARGLGFPFRSGFSPSFKFQARAKAQIREIPMPPG